MCQACLRRGIENVLPKRADKKKGQESADVDHIIPLKVKPQLAYDPENLQTLCHSCHSRKTRVEMNHGRRVVVTGPPNSGKTTHVKQNAKQGATIWDADDIVKVMTGRGRHDWPEHMMAVIPAMLNALVQTMQMNDCPELWIIVTDKHRARQIALMLGAEVVEKTER